MTTSLSVLKANLPSIPQLINPFNPPLIPVNGSELILLKVVLLYFSNLY